MIHNILRNENYVGNIVYNRTSRRLGQKLVNNPRDRWVRSDLVLDPMINQTLFARAQEIMADRYVSLSEDEMLRQLRLLLKRKGRLTTSIIDAASGMPSAPSYIKHFGSLRRAFDLIGYKSPRDYDWVDSRAHWLEVLEVHARQVAEALNSAKHVKARFAREPPYVVVSRKVCICFQVARQLKKREPHYAASWRAYRRKRQTGLLIVLRLDEANRTIADYLILAASKIRADYLSFSEAQLHGAIRVATMPELIASILRHWIVRGA